MRFGNPHFFWLLFCIPLCIGFFIWAYQQKQRAMRQFADMAFIARLAPFSTLQRQVTKWILFLLFCFFLVIALTRPRFGVQMEMVERKGVDIIVALDISESMLAEDIVPNRLVRAKHEIAKFIDLLRGDRIGIVVFAGESFVQCPLTLDYGAAKMFLDAVETDWITLQGTAVADAIQKSVEAFRSKKKKHKVLIVLSDGEDHEGEAVNAAQTAAKEGVTIYTVGIGSEDGVPIPVRKRSGSVVYKKDTQNNLVMTRLNPMILEEIALEGGGKYFHAGTRLDLSRIYNQIARMEEKDFGMTKLAVFEERYQMFLAVGLFLFLLEFFIPDRKRKKEEQWKGRFT
jgi:Ca-activated chloride channel family protein